MKLHESLRKIIRQYGVSVMSEKRLLFILADFRAFDEYPAMRQVLDAIVKDGAGKEICRLFLEEDSSGCLSYAQDIRKSLLAGHHFRQDLAGYAADSLLFGIGLQNSVTEPSYHGFDPIEHSNAAGNAGAGATLAGGVQTPGAAGYRAMEAGNWLEEMNRSGSREHKADGTGSSLSGTARPADRWPYHGNSGVQTNGSKSFVVRAVLVFACLFLFGVIVSSIPGGRNSEMTFGPAESTAVNISDSRSDGNKGQDSPAAGEPSAEYEYKQGEIYYYGRGVRQNYAEAARWYRKAAEKGWTWAQYSLGFMYEHGQGVDRNYAEAARWYRRAANHGNDAARTRAESAEALISGDGGRSKAGMRQRADSADGSADVKTAGQYEYEQGEKYYYAGNDAEAARWYRKAAEHGWSWAQYSLGFMYEHGHGVDQNYDEAAMWYRKAAEQGNDAARARLESLGK